MADYGLGGTGATLAARLPDPLGVATFILTNEEPGNHRVWLLPPDTAPHLPYFAFTISGGAPTFPYSRDVPPDVPM